MLHIFWLIFGTGKDIILYLGLFVVKITTELTILSMYSGALITIIYWPRCMTSHKIYCYLVDKELGDAFMLEDKVEDRQPFRIFFMKEPNLKKSSTWDGIRMYRFQSPIPRVTIRTLLRQPINYEVKYHLTYNKALTDINDLRPSYCLCKCYHILAVLANSK